MEPTRILGKYKVVYENGVNQSLNLVSHADYEQIIKPKQRELYDYELQYYIEKNPQIKENIKRIKRELHGLFGEHWFTDESPLFKASESGYLILPETQGGSHKCTVTKITEP